MITEFFMWYLRHKNHCTVPLLNIDLITLIDVCLHSGGVFVNEAAEYLFWNHFRLFKSKLFLWPCRCRLCTRLPLVERIPHGVLLAGAAAKIWKINIELYELMWYYDKSVSFITVSHSKYIFKFISLFMNISLI